MAEYDDLPPVIFNIDETGVVSRKSEHPQAREQSPITQEEINWLKDQFPFVQVITAGDTPATEASIIKSPNTDWNIVDYGNAMCTSPGEHLFSSGYFRTRRSDDEEGGGIVTLNNGTIINHMYLITEEIVQLAQEKDWASLHIVDGERRMGRFIWIHGTRAGIPVTNFEPTETDLRVAKRIDAKRDQLKSIQPPSST